MEPLTWAGVGAIAWQGIRWAFGKYAARNQDRRTTQRKLLHGQIEDARKTAEVALGHAHKFFCTAVAAERASHSKAVIHETKLLAARLQTINTGLRALDIKLSTVSEMVAFRQALTLGTEPNHGGQTEEAAQARIYTAHHNLHIALCSLLYTTS